MRVACHDYNWIPYAHRQGETLDLEHVLAEMVEAGYDAVEFSRHPMEMDDPERTRKLLAHFGLKLVGMSMTFKGNPGELETLTEKMRVLVSWEGERVVLFDGIDWDAPTAVEAAGPYHGTVELAEGVAEFAASLGLDTVIHNHLGTNLETPEQMDTVLPQLQHCGLCLDTGHLIAAGGNPVVFTHRYAGVLRHVHFKDCRFNPDGSFDDFVELGTGNSPCRMEDVLGAFREVGYEGWLCLEQDRTGTTPIESARANREFLRRNGL
ncbi:MAG TPA: TIM barrel protein [Planctomycetota bacterium]|nr:TIM barrel protein [Planctomycetota bacterium]